MSDRRWPARRARVLAAVALAALGAHAALADTAPPAAAQAARPTAASRELDRAQALLQLRLASLPEGSGVLILREHESMTLRIPARLLFEPDSATLKADAAAAAPLAASVQVLRKHGRLQARIVAYTDSIGEPSANQALSDQRAQAVAGVLSAAGVSSARLQPQGVGAATMVAGNDTPQGRIENRRIEIEFGRAGQPAS